MSSREEEGRRIAQRLGQGVVYYGLFMPSEVSEGFLGYTFEDAAVTKSSFVAVDYEHAKEQLIKLRKDWHAKAPVFANNPGNISITREEWDRSFLRALPVVSLAVGVLSAATGILVMQRYTALGQRVYFQD
ncbi:MAG: hypothetical protein HWN68_21160, partial [Desulfobacterales bacterium]|nr:hypothetical protein [Desulfobacterales bacterium]